MPALEIERPMGRVVRALSIVLLAGLGIAPGAGAQQPSPRAAAERFYAAYLQLHVSGLPDAEQSKVLMPLFTPAVRRLFQAAAVEQDRALREQPDEKPPWVEGDLFSSLFEGATSYSLGKSRVQKTKAEVDVHLVYKYKADATEWMDTVVLTKVNERWVISDILFKGNWAFMNGASLRASLTN